MTRSARRPSAPNRSLVAAMSAGAILAAAGLPAGAQDSTSLTIYSSAEPGAVPADTYRPVPTGAYGYTSYNQIPVPGFGVIRQERTLNIPSGRSTLLFSDVAAYIDPTTVMFQSLTDPAGTRVLEQDYRFDLIDLGKMLQRHVGQEINLGGQKVTLLSVTNGGMLVKDSSKQIYFVSGYSNVYFSEQMAEGLITEPTLQWEVHSTSGGEQRARVSYQTSGITWWADYNVVLTEPQGASSANSASIDLGAWVSILNRSGAGYENATLKLIAGDVNRIRQEQVMYRRAAGERLGMADEAAGFQEKSFFEYHLYTLGRPTTIPDNSTKQIELFDAAPGVPAEKILVYYGAPMPPWWSWADPYTERDLGVPMNTKVDTYLRFRNSKENGLGVPLPKGRIRVSKLDTADGSLEFIGEDAIDHTPKDEDVLVRLGSAFDIVGERIQTDFKVNSAQKWLDESFEITLRNHKDQAVTVLVKESLFRWSNWEIRQASHDHEKVDARTIHFPVTIPADGEVKVTYTVHYTW